jgi:hypothetical protein
LPPSAASSAESPARASATIGNADSLAASNPATLMLTNFTSGFWNAVRDAVVKSLYRVPTPITTSASRASRLATGVPVEPTPPTEFGWSQPIAPLPAWVSATGMPVCRANRSSSSDASP